MKYIISLTLILFSFVRMNSQDINPDEKPLPLKEAGSFKFPDYTVQTLSNGLKVFIIEDNEQPTVAYRLMIGGGTSVEGPKSGIAEITASMLTKGTKSKSAAQIASQMDGVGATLASSASTDYYIIYADGLKKHSKLIIESLADVLLNPTFPEDEFLKMQQQIIAGLQYEKSDAGAIAQQLARIAAFGKEHPYSARKTEESVNSIKVSDLQEFHSAWAKPNNATIAVVGDVKAKEVIAELEKYFKNWKKSDVPAIKIPNINTMPKGVYFVNRKGAVQTSLIVTSVGVPLNNIDYDNLRMATNLIGGDNGRLFQTLREKYSFTYSPYAFLTQNKFANRFAAVADVGAEKTDSSLIVIMNELKDLASNTPSKEELLRVKTSFLGAYAMSFENSMSVAARIQTDDFNGIKISETKNYSKKIESINPSDITSAVKSFISSDNVRIIAVGDPAIAPSLEKYGQVYYYDLDLNPLSGADAKIEKISMSPKELIAKYEKALGGSENISKIRSINASSMAELNAGGQRFEGEVLNQKKTPNKVYNYSDFGVFNSQAWVDGENCWTGMKGMEATMQYGDSKAKMMFEAELFPVLALEKYDFKLEVLGTQAGMILMNVTDKSGALSTYYFNKDSFLLEKIDLYLNSPDGKQEIWSQVSADYAEFEGVKLPKLQKTISPNFVITLKTNYTINPEIDDAVFKPAM